MHHLEILVVALARKLRKLERLQQLTNLYKPCHIGVTVQKVGLGLCDYYYEYVESAEIKPDAGEVLKKSGQSRKKIQAELSTERSNRKT